jgi:hypothetical protein
MDIRSLGIFSSWAYWLCRGVLPVKWLSRVVCSLAPTEAPKVFRLDRNHGSDRNGFTVHFQSESVFTLKRIHRSDWIGFSKHATRILDMRATDPSEGWNCAWLSDHELLYFRPDGNLWRRDIKTGAETVLPALTRQLNISIPYSTIHWLLPSPDGKWLIWGEAGPSPLFVTSVDGARQFSWPKGRSKAHWLPDSQHWSHWEYGYDMNWTEVEIHNVSTPDQSQGIDTPPAGLKGLDVLAVQSEDVIIARTRDVDRSGAVIASGRGYITIITPISASPPPFRDIQELSVWSLHSAKPLHQFTIHLSGPALDVKVSPQGDRVVWLVQRQNTSPAFKLLQRLFPAWKGDDHESLAIYASKLDGSQMQEIGRVDSKATTDRLIEEMRWLPGGKRLSFIVNDTLWTVPVE